MANLGKALALLCGLFLLVDLSALAQTSGSGTIARSGSMVGGTVYDRPPVDADLIARSRAFMEQPKQDYVPPEDPSWTPAPPNNAPVRPANSQLLVPGDYQEIRNSNLGPPGGFVSAVDEPSLAQSGRTVLYTGNWFAGFSEDYGQTWSFYNPYDNFPADGVTDVPPNSGTFCCDQVSTYDDQHNAFFWYLQYGKNGSTSTSSNVGRIAVAQGQEGVINNSWCWYDFQPSFVGGALGEWFDFPHISTTDNYLYFTSNVFTTTTGSYVRSVIVRIDLDDLSSCSMASFDYFTGTSGSFRMADGATTTMYFANHSSSTALRVYDWPEANMTPSSRTVTHDGFSFSNMTALCPDGTDNADRSDTRVMAGWLSSSAANGDEVGFMWNAAQNATFPYPYVKMLRIDVSSWTLLQDFKIWDNDAAWLYPSAAVSEDGYLGGTIFYGCGAGLYPAASAWLVDDFSSPAYPDLNGFEAWVFAPSDDGPNADVSGDYLWAQRNVPYRNTWVGTGFRLTGGGGNANVTPEFIWWGREDDMPPAVNTIFVDNANVSTFETGEEAHPYNTVEGGHFAATPGDLIIIKGGTPYLETMLFDKELQELRQNASGGNVVIGGNE